jgi:putative peptidoglycan lipid II flippase
MSSSKKNHAINAIVVIIGLTLFSKVIGFVRDALIGSQFGIGIDSDAYFMGLGITTTIFLSLGTGIATSIIPISVKLEGNSDKNKVLSSIINSILMISGIITLICFIFTPQLVSLFASGFIGEKYELTIFLTRIMIPTVFFIALAYLYVGLLQAHERYLLPAMISVPYNLLAIAFLFIGVKSYGIVGLAVVTTIGWFLQMAIQLPKVYQVTKLKYSFTLDFKNNYVKEFMTGIISISIIAATQQLTYLSDNTMVSHFGDGKVAALYYSNMLFIAIVTTAVYGITAVMFPKFNKKFVEVDKSAFYSSIDMVLKGIILLLAPISVGLALVGENAVSIIFMRGEFTLEDARITALLLIGFAGYMVAFGIWDVLNKAFYTMGNKRIPLFISGVIIISNIILNFIGAHFLGLIGIPLATSLAFYIGIIFSFILFKNNEGSLDIKGIIITLLKAATSVTFMAAAILSIHAVLENNMNVIQFSSRLILLITDVGIGIIVYMVSLLILKEKNIIEIIKAVKDRKKEKGGQGNE